MNTAAPRAVWHPVSYGADLAAAPAFPRIADRCTGCCVVARNYNPEQPDSVMQAFERTIFDRDRRIVESQVPATVPFGEARDLHLAFDKVALAWRRAMRDQGLAASQAA